MFKQKLFVRVDDVYELNTELITLLDFAKKYNLVLSIGIIPLKIKKNCIDYILKKEKEGSLNIHQHGVRHEKTGVGELGGENESTLIKMGKTKMREYFGRNPKIISLPWQYHGKNSLALLDKNGYKLLSAHFDQRLKGKMFYFVGRIFRKSFFLGHHVSYHNRYIPGTNIFELSTSVDTLSSYNPLKWKNFRKIKSELDSVKIDKVGLLMHPIEITENKAIVAELFNYIHKKYEVFGLLE